MSQFATKIPVDLDAVKKLLPTNSHIEAVRWNPDQKELELRWSNDRLQTPFTFHSPFAVELLKAKDLPEGVTLRPERKATGNTPVDAPKEPAKKVVDRKPKRAEKGT